MKQWFLCTTAKYWNELPANVLLSLVVFPSSPFFLIYLISLSSTFFSTSFSCLSFSSSFVISLRLTLWQHLNPAFRWPVIVRYCHPCNVNIIDHIDDNDSNIPPLPPPPLHTTNRGEISSSSWIPFGYILYSFSAFSFPFLVLFFFHSWFYCCSHSFRTPVSILILPLGYGYQYCTYLFYCMDKIYFTYTFTYYSLVSNVTTSRILLWLLSYIVYCSVLYWFVLFLGSYLYIFYLTNEVFSRKKQRGRRFGLDYDIYLLLHLWN